jgi:16S rRNA (cytidine1402-2'-O)-methyltransferase
MLYIVPTPIGNLEDITLRALRLMKESTIVICEDPRVATKLFDLLEIDRTDHRFVPILKNHQFNQTIEKVLEEELDQDVLLMSDAGMPIISDPGREVVIRARGFGHDVVALPGADSVTAAAAVSGLVSKEFRFVGFPPIKKGRAAWWKDISDDTQPVILFESVHRMPRALEDMQEHLDQGRQVCICKDLTKMYENVWIGSVSDLKSYEFTPKGEYVIVVGRKF